MKRLMTIAGTTALALGLLVGPAAADLVDTGKKGDVEDSCEALGGEFEASGWGQSGDPTCVVETEGELKETPGVKIERAGGETVYTHEGTETDKSQVTAGSWDDGESTGGGELCITVKKTGNIICPKGQNK
jgi:hypothetical protein